MRGRLLVPLALICTGTGAYNRPHLTGHDFDFSATYASGLQFSTSYPPTDVLPAREIALREPVITLNDSSDAGGDARYVTFLEISYYPSIDMIDDIIYAFPWIKTEQLVLENGTLTDDFHHGSRIYHEDYIPSGEVRNATMHVWKQTDDLMSFLTGDEMPVLFQLARVWANSSSKAPTDFLRANIDFKTQNQTGTCRGDVDQNGATITGSATTTACSATATSGVVSSTTTAIDTSATTTASAVSATTTPNASAIQYTTSSVWSLIIPCTLLVSSAMFMI
ncbi:hypothetical protein F4810DRAFT_208704 [Camillea tinctor]|nr:hypothetical protein F4810DRAFT_208704 [Camillea tinctor]